MTTKFKVMWPDGSETVEVSETATPDAYAMERWGMESAAAVFEAHHVEIYPSPEEPAPATPEEPKTLHDDSPHN